MNIKLNDDDCTVVSWLKYKYTITVEEALQLLYCHDHSEINCSDPSCPICYKRKAMTHRAAMRR